MSDIEQFDPRDYLFPGDPAVHPTVGAQYRIVPDTVAFTPPTNVIVPGVAVPAAAHIETIDQTGLNLIEEFEGYIPRAIFDPFGHVWTVGYGETQGIGPGSTMTRAQAQDDLERRLAEEYEPAVRGLGIPLNEHQFDALCSFVWNVGPGSMSSSFDIGRLLREREYLAAANAMLEYVRAGGVVLEGLVRRREAERALFLTPMPPPPDPHHYKRFPLFVRAKGHKYNPRRVVETYDKLRVHGVRNRKRLAPIRAHLHILADHEWHQAHLHPDHADWSHRRGWLYQEYLHRANGRKVMS